MILSEINRINRVKRQKKDKARQYKPSTVRRLDTLSANQCAYPNCEKKLIAEDGVSIISKICHISAASKNGPRYDESMTDDDRRSFDNLILLCDEHHVMVDNKDNESKYSVSLLKEWKTNHVLKVMELMSSKNLLSAHPLALNTLVNILGSKMNEILDLPEALEAPNTAVKISYNNLKIYELIIREYAPYQIKLNEIYEEIEKEGSNKKHIILNMIRMTYIRIRREYNDLSDIKENSDAIMDKVIEQIWERIEDAPNKIGRFDQETIEFSLMIIIVDAFMRCNILEEPKK